MTEKRKLKALIAEDEAHLRKLLRTIISSRDIEITWEAKNGQEAIELFKDNAPDMVFLDINMPIKTGDEALAEILSDTPDAFVIMMTSVSDMEVVKKCIDLGAANYILKDTPLTEMRQIIKETWRDFQEERRK